MQLASKMRFISAQFDALFTGDLWLKSAQHANRMARLLQKELSEIPQVKIVYKVEANGVFAKIPRPAIAKLQKALLLLRVERSSNLWCAGCARSIRPSRT